MTSWWRRLLGRPPNQERVRVQRPQAVGLDVLRPQDDGPLEPPEGQDPDPPNLHLAVLVALLLLRDVRQRLGRPGRRRGRDLVLRVRALVKVLRRIRDELEGGEQP